MKRYLFTSSTKRISKASYKQ